MEKRGERSLPVHELVTTSGGMPIFAGNHLNATLTEFSDHWHRSVEVTYNWVGEMEVYINGEYSRLCGGDLLLINSGQIHRIVPLICEEAMPNEVRATTVLLPYEFFRSAYPSLDATYFVLREGQRKRELSELVKQIGGIFQSAIQEYDYMRVHSLAWQMMYYLCSFFAEKRSVYISQQEEQNLGNIYRILTWLKDHYDLQMTEQEIASQFHFSREHFSRLIKRYTGMNFKAYLTKQRLLAAHDKLTKTEDSILQIALECGFGDSRAFIRAFTNAYMETPGRYRKKLREQTKQEIVTIHGSGSRS